MLDTELIMFATPDDLVSLGRPLGLANLGGKTVCTYCRDALNSNDRFPGEIETRGVSVKLVLFDDREYSGIDCLVNDWLFPPCHPWPLGASPCCLRIYRSCKRYR